MTGMCSMARLPPDPPDRRGQLLTVTTVEMACLKISCSWLLVSSTSEYLSKLRISSR